MNFRKRAVSIRMHAGDIDSIKRLAKRLGVRDSDVIRSAVRVMIAKLAPLADASVRGRSLVPVLLESGGDLLRHFDIDSARLEGIVNEGADAESKVEHGDVQLIVMNGMQRSYIKLRLNAMNGNGLEHGKESGMQSYAAEHIDDSLRQYLYDKYVY